MISSVYMPYDYSGHGGNKVMPVEAEQEPLELHCAVEEMD